ncbi:MAG: presenilin family intramembrane aspartyl protease [Candidatus Nanoarchaeia archaeon]
MKHKLSITLTILGMFLLIQFIGLYVVNIYSPTQQQIVNETGQVENITIKNPLPYNLEPPEQAMDNPWQLFYNLLIGFVLAIFLIMIFMKYKWKTIIKIWFFVVIILALSISINAFIHNLAYSSLIAFFIALPVAYFKVYKPNIYLHNITELLIYPGIAAVFVSILTPITIAILLILISIYDMWAVWHSGIMQKMAKFQMDELKIFGGLMIPYIPKKLRAKIKKSKKSKKNKKIKVSLGILGGGDIVFPIIAAGSFLRAFGLIPALLVIAGAFAGLTFLMFLTQKGKYYPAMPFISGGIFIGMIISFLI